MLRLVALSHPPIPFPIPIPVQPHTHLNYFSSTSLLFKTQTEIPKRPIRFVALANNNNGLNQQEREDEKEKEEGIGSNGGDEMGKNGRSIFSNIRWGDLLLDPDPNNILAVGLTGLLTWASVQVLWQLLFISLAILVAALKYSFIAALKYSFIAAVLLFILITLL